MNWERAAQRDRVRVAGSDPEERQIVRRPPCTHKWSPWTQTGPVDARWRRKCARCKKIQVRANRPTREPPEASRPQVRVARTKGDLVVRRVDGTGEIVPAKDATRAARDALATAAERERIRDSTVAPGSVRKASPKKRTPAPSFKKTVGESSIDRVFRGVPVAKASKPVPPAAAGKRKRKSKRAQPPPQR